MSDPPRPTWLRLAPWLLLAGLVGTTGATVAWATLGPPAPARRSARAPATGTVVSRPAPTTSPAVTTTTVAPPGSWPQRALATVRADVQDLSPTPDALFWLQSTPARDFTQNLAPVRLDLESGARTTGPSITGVTGMPALTVTGNSVWLVSVLGATVTLTWFDPRTLAVAGSRQLGTVPTFDGSPEDAPVLTATVDGPLWVAAGTQLWAVDPTTGDVVLGLDTDDTVSSMSTDPSGEVLYTGGQLDGGGTAAVIEYDARTGRQLDHATIPGFIEGATVSAATDGVWVSGRGGMSGETMELSRSGLVSEPTPRSPGAGELGSYFDDMGGVDSEVSDGVVWLSSNDGLACADPATDTVRAHEPPLAFTETVGPVAARPDLYTVESSENGSTTSVDDVLPPAACWG